MPPIRFSVNPHVELYSQYWLEEGDLGLAEEVPHQRGIINCSDSQNWNPDFDQICEVLMITQCLYSCCKNIVFLLHKYCICIVKYVCICDVKVLYLCYKNVAFVLCFRKRRDCVCVAK